MEERVPKLLAEAYSTRCLSRSDLPRPYICLLMSLSLLILPSSISRPSDKRNALAAGAHVEQSQHFGIWQDALSI
jgi:hypothetical protein